MELKSFEFFQRFCTSLATHPTVERAQPSDATSPELSHGTCIQPGPVDVRPSLWLSPLGASPKSSRVIEQFGSTIGRSPPQLARTWADFCPEDVVLGALFECDCHKELSQIQASSLNSLKFLILPIRPAPFLNMT